MDLHKEAARIFDDLFMVTFQQLGFMGIQVEPADVVKRVISPVKDVYLKGLLDLLALSSSKPNGGTRAEEALKKPE
jgi:hypothetical protein